jgi:hypothetical protein
MKVYRCPKGHKDNLQVHSVLTRCTFLSDDSGYPIPGTLELEEIDSNYRYCWFYTCGVCKEFVDATEVSEPTM